MTLLARDEADIVDAHVSFHLNAGVDFVIATDNRSQDGTTAILESYARVGCLHLIHEPGEGLRQGEWVTRMARLAATELGADWVINSDADEFWWPRGGSLKDVLAAVPERYGIVQGFWRPFVPRPDVGGFFAERMTVRLSPKAPINDPTSFYRPQHKVAHRADPHVTVGRGNHALVGGSLLPLRGWYPIEVLHFPLRSLEQWKRKSELQGTAFAKYIARPGTGYHAKAYDALRRGRIEEHYESMVVGDGELERGVAEDSLVIDTRLRDALRELRADQPGSSGRQFSLPAEVGPVLSFPAPTVTEDAAYASEATLLGEADVVRVRRELDRLEHRLLSIELRLGNRLYRKLSGAAKRVLRRELPAPRP